MATVTGHDKAVLRNGGATHEAQTGLTLLWLLAQAADRETLNWVNRRVEQLEFLDTRAVRWRVSIDFTIPPGAPVVQDGGRVLRLVPLTSWKKGNLVAFNICDEAGSTMWLPASEYTTGLFSSALEYWATEILRRAQSVDPHAKSQDPAALREPLKELVSAKPAERSNKKPKRKRKEDEEPAIAGDVIKAAIDNELTDHQIKAAQEFATTLNRLHQTPEFKSQVKSFNSQMAELSRNFIVVAAVTGLPGTRRVLKLTFESDIKFRLPKDWMSRLWQSLGWRAWRLDVLIGGRGGSHHLEVAAPPGVDIVQISARPAYNPMPADTITVPGGSPDVHIKIPESRRVRYRATIRVRVSRPGWLTNSFLIAVVIAAVLIIGRVKLSVLFSASSGAATGQASAAAALLLALLGVFATMLIDPGEHPLASRLLFVSRVLIIIDAAAVLVGVGNLLLHSDKHPPAVWWTVLAVLSGIVAVFMAVSWRLPIGPRVKGKQRKRNAEKKKTAPSQPDPARVDIPAADGYHYGDDHVWDDTDQANLVRELKNVRESLGPRGLERFSAVAYRLTDSILRSMGKRYDRH
jgi:hypothetical protein